MPLTEATGSGHHAALSPPPSAAPRGGKWVFYHVRSALPGGDAAARLPYQIKLPGLPQMCMNYTIKKNEARIKMREKQLVLLSNASEN